MAPDAYSVDVDDVVGSRVLAGHSSLKFAGFPTSWHSKLPRDCRLRSACRASSDNSTRSPLSAPGSFFGPWGEDGQNLSPGGQIGLGQGRPACRLSPAMSARAAERGRGVVDRGLRGTSRYSQFIARAEPRRCHAEPGQTDRGAAETEVRRTAWALKYHRMRGAEKLPTLRNGRGRSVPRGPHLEGAL